MRAIIATVLLVSATSLAVSQSPSWKYEPTGESTRLCSSFVNAYNPRAYYTWAQGFLSGPLFGKRTILLSDSLRAVRVVRIQLINIRRRIADDIYTF
jgi:hypothetical protein